MRRHRQALVLPLVGAVVLGAGALAAAAAPPPSVSPAAKAQGQGAVAAADALQLAAVHMDGHDLAAANEHGSAGATQPMGAGKGAAKKTSTATGSTGAASRSACASSAPFSQFGDDGRYALLTNGTLETGGPARRSGKRSIVSENESFHLHAAGDTRSLQLGSGDSVAFHAMCLPRLNPDFRFVARAVAGTGSLKLQVQYGPAGRMHAVQLGTLAAGDYSSWAATPALPFLDGAKRLVDQVKGNVWLVLSVAGSATWRVDDLYIDPYVNK